MRVVIRQAANFDGYCIWLYDRHPQSSNTLVAKPVELTFSEIEGDAWLLPEPTFTISGPLMMADNGAFVASLIEQLEFAGAVKHTIFKEKETTLAIKEAMGDHIKNLMTIIDSKVK